MPTYEELLKRIGELTRPEEPAQRNVGWLTDSRAIGISKTHEDRIEIFLAGAALKPVSRTLKEAIEHQPWWHQGAEQPAFEANRMLLPGIGYFDQVAAFLCAELLRLGIDDDLERAFSEAEPILELAIERLRLSDGAFLGLAGELLLIGSLCRCAEDAVVARVVESWQGWHPSLRDFSWGTLGVEVKATSRASSTHQIQGTHQVELNDGEGGGQAETGLYFVSIGLEGTGPHENSSTVPELTEGILERLCVVGRSDLVEPFLARVKEYGSGAGFGYDHHTMRSDPAFTRTFVVAFVRAYDMTDTTIAVIRRDDAARYQHVDPGTVRYSVRLPTQITGDLNPVVGLNQTALAILDSGPGA